MFVVPTNALWAKQYLDIPISQENRLFEDDDDSQSIYRKLYIKAQLSEKYFEMSSTKFCFLSQHCKVVVTDPEKVFEKKFYPRCMYLYLI